MGCGKTSVGRELASRLGWRFVDLDDAVCAMEHRTVAEIFADGGEDAFRAAESRALKAELHTTENTVIALGGGTVTRSEARELVLSRTTSIYLRARLGSLLEYLEGDTSRPLYDKSTAGVLLRNREEFYLAADFTVDVDGLAPAQVCDLLLEREIVGGVVHTSKVDCGT